MAWKIHSVHPPSTNFYRRGVKKCGIWPYIQQHSSLSRCGLKTEQDILTVFKLEEHRWLFYVLPKFGAVVRPTYPWEPLSGWGPHIGILNSSALLSQPVQRFPTKRYKRLGPRLDLQNRLRYFAHPSPNFYRGIVRKVRKFTKWSITRPRIVWFLLKFGTEFDHLTPDLQQTFKVTGWKVTVTA